MGKPETCLRCGSGKLIPTGRICGLGAADAQVFVDRKPEAWFGRTDPEQEPLRACICVDCGHVEAFVVTTEGLAAAYEDSLRRQQAP